jgi:uncharacterized protein (DUF1015 family)
VVEISPFRAIRYALDDVSAVLAPPYDVIDEREQDALYARHPHNIVRIDLNKPEPADHPTQRYQRAAGFLEAWLEEQVLIQDPTPSLYVLAQTFTGPDGRQRTRTGFFARARLYPFEEGQILPHERTLRGPKVDRLELFRATRTNLSPIFGAYRDRDGAVRRALEEAQAGAPLYDARMSGVQNRLWRLTGAAAQAVCGLFSGKKLFIADGHHRYETGLAYREERRAARGGVVEADAGYEHILMFSAAVEDPGMVIFPTHRLVHSVAAFPSAAELEDKLSRFFAITGAPADPAAAQAELAKAGQRGNAFLLATAAGPKILVLKDEAPLGEAVALPKEPALRTLDVSVLHALILEQLLGIHREAQASQANLRYSKDFAEAMTAPARDRSVQAAFLMNATKIDEVIAVAESGQVMPQKSTFIYPKIPSGLVLYPLG